LQETAGSGENKPKPGRGGLPVEKRITPLLHLGDGAYTVPEMVDVAEANGLLEQLYGEAAQKNRARVRKSCQEGIRAFVRELPHIRVTISPVNSREQKVYDGATVRRAAEAAAAKNGHLTRAAPSGSTGEATQPAEKPAGALRRLPRLPSWIAVVMSVGIAILIGFTTNNAPEPRYPVDASREALIEAALAQRVWHPVISEETDRRERARLSERYGIELASTGKGSWSFPDTPSLARKLAEHHETPYTLDLTELVAVLPDRPWPVWIFRDGQRARVVEIGTRLRIPEGAGHVLEVQQEGLVIQHRDRISFLERPVLAVSKLFRELPGRKSVFYPLDEGNVPILADFLGIEAGPGNLVGFFAADLDDAQLREKVIGTSREAIPVTIGIQENVKIFVTEKKLLQWLMTHTPGKVDIQITGSREDQLYFTGQSLQSVIQSFDILCERRGDTIVLWR